MSNICHRIKTARKISNLTQAKLGKAIGSKTSSISQWEQGIAHPTAEKTELLARELKVSFEWLATGRGVPSLENANSYIDVSSVLSDPTIVRLSEEDKEFLDKFKLLNPIHKSKVLDVITAFNALQKWQI